MTLRQETAPERRPQLNAAGLTSLASLLDGEADDGRFPGEWTALIKPGLGGRRRWRWIPADANSDDDALYVKRYARTPLKEQWDRLLRQCTFHGRAHWEYQQSLRLNASHVPAPPAVGYAERMLGPFERVGVVILGRAPGDGFDREWTRLTQVNSPLTRGLARIDVAKRLARFVAAFHGTGNCHRDLYLCHVFVDFDESAVAPPRFTLIDLARTHQPRWRRMRWLIKDLSQLDFSARQIGASRTDRWRFLLAYLNLPRGAVRARWYARRILKKSNWIMRREQRKRNRS